MKIWPRKQTQVSLAVNSFTDYGFYISQCLVSKQSTPPSRGHVAALISWQEIKSQTPSLFAQCLQQQRKKRVRHSQVRKEERQRPSFLIPILPAKYLPVAFQLFHSTINFQSLYVLEAYESTTQAATDMNQSPEYTRFTAQSDTMTHHESQGFPFCTS